MSEAKPGLASTLANFGFDLDGAIARSVLQQRDVKRLTGAVVACHFTDTSAGRAEVRIDYDAMGNRVRIQTTIASGNVNRQDDGWYRYDSMHRQIVVNAINADGELGQQGRRIGYDLAGNRISETWWGRTVDPASANPDANFTDLLANLVRAQHTGEQA